MSIPHPVHSPACERARVWASQELDGELSPLERAALRSHLVDCPGCRAFAAAVRTVTGELRSAPCAVPEPLPLPQARARRRPYVLASAAAAVAAAVALGSLIGTLTRGGTGAAAPHATRGAIAATQEPYVEQSLLAMLERLHPPTGRTVAV